MKKFYQSFSCKHIYVLFLFLCSLPFISQAQIFTNPISGTNPNTSNPYTTGQTVNANITVSGIGRGTGIAGTNANDRYNANAWNLAAFDANDYFEWTITPNSGFEIDFSDLVFVSQTSGTGPVNFAFRSSADGFTANIGSPTATGATISLTGASFQNITAAITFRLYGWGASGAAGTFSVNSFTFNGTVSAVAVTPIVTVTATDANAAEAGTDAGTFQITRTGATTATLAVSYTIGGTAAGTDYTPTLTGTATIAIGQSTVDITITPVDDASIEGSETVTLTLTDELAYDLDANTSATVTIADNDFLPTLSINNVTLSEGNAGTTNFEFTVSLSSPAPTGGVTFDFTTADNTATQGSFDYDLLSETGSTIAAGESTFTIVVVVNGDTDVEPDETFFVNLTNVVGATLIDGQGQGTITNDDFITPDFDQLGPYCVGATPDALPTTSTNGITGSWSPATISTATAGTITYTFTPDGGQSAISATMMVTVVDNPTLTGSDIVCEGSSITLTGSRTPAAVDPYVSSNTLVATVSATGEVAGVAEGTVTITYTNDNGCTATATVTVTALPVFTPVVTQPTCDNPGLISIPAIISPAGTYTYEYSTTGGAPFSAMTLNGGNYEIVLLAGTQAASTYTLQVTRTDVIPSCFSTATANINAVSGCTTCSASLTREPGTLCAGDPGILKININDGTGNYTISIDTDGILGTAEITDKDYEDGADILVNPSITTTYTLLSVIDNGNGNQVCNLGSPVTITVISAPTATISGGGNVCAPATTATVTVSGTPNAVVVLSDNTMVTIEPDGSTNISLGAGTYTITTVNSAAPESCEGSGSGSVNVTVNPAPTATISGGGNVCTPATTATVTISGTPNAVVVLSNSTMVTIEGDGSTDISLGAGTYTINSVTSAAPASCPGTGSGSATVTVTPIPTPSITVTENSGTNPNDGIICEGASVTLATSGGGNYAWSAGPTPAAPSITVSPNITTTYTVTVTNNGCVGTATQVITVNSKPTVGDPDDQTVCDGASVPELILGAVSTTYDWINNTTSIGLGAGGNGNVPGFVANNKGNAPVIATITVTETENGCTSDPQTYTITVNPKVEPTFTQLGPYCQGDTPAALPTTSNNSIPGNWSPSTINTQVPGTATYNFFVQEGQCADSSNMKIVVNPSVTVEAGTPQTICSTTSLNLTTIGASISGGTTAGTWSSSGTGSFTGGTAFGTATAYVPSQADKTAGTVTLTLTSADPTGPCPAVIDTVVITINTVGCTTFPWNGGNN